MVVDSQVMTKTYKEHTFTILRNFIVNSVEQAIFHIIANLVQFSKKVFKNILEFLIKQSLNILNHKELGHLCPNHANVGEKQLASLIIKSMLLTCYAPRLTRRTPNEAITIWNIFGVNTNYIFFAENRIRVILFIGRMNVWFELISPNHLESSLFKTKVKTSASSEKRYYIHFYLSY